MKAAPTAIATACVALIIPLSVGGSSTAPFDDAGRLAAALAGRLDLRKVSTGVGDCHSGPSAPCAYAMYATGAKGPADIAEELTRQGVRFDASCLQTPSCSSEPVVSGGKTYEVEFPARTSNDSGLLWIEVREREA